MNTVIELEDNGQDFLDIEVDETGVIIETRPFQTSIWKGAYIPVESLVIGSPCHIHHPPNINYGYLKHNVKSITPATNGN